MSLEEMHFQTAKKPNSGSIEASYPKVEDFTTRQERHFQATRMLKTCSPESR
jgi:hypothetical protein